MYRPDMDDGAFLLYGVFLQRFINAKVAMPHRATKTPFTSLHCQMISFGEGLSLY